MPDYTFFGWTAADLGMSSIFDLFSGGPFTVAGTAENITISDGAGDTSFDDAPDQGSPDPLGDQQASGDIILDGTVVIPDGGSVWNIGEFTVTNTTTGEVGTLIVFGDTAGNPIGMASTIQFSVGDVLTYSNFNTNGAQSYDSLVCFTGGTHIATEQGTRLIEDLEVGDKVQTLTNGLQEIQWIGRRKVPKWMLAQNSKLQPVRISSGALGSGLPVRDLVVSRQHRMLVRSKVATRMFGEPEVLVAAIRLAELPGIFVDTDHGDVEYFHLLFDRHEVIIAEGAPSESLYTGPEALKAVSPEAREELLAIFPELMDQTDSLVPAFQVPSGKRQRKLVLRHSKNGIKLIDGTSAADLSGSNS
ncbi:Hint domain-containing protein [Aliiroseovarius halocynthiae]|uniref:Hint domain-containing protein n=1 Tax=Aliiroseovarius halocynthiae TaxID=985055 RepID=A0A545SP23_9RHOB|nr:Hint domain-containing protein [Aliiroseovarius halocynthiae]TQV66740.1 Hint domain-containing protein [Aliiroseovarius halocynthiae]SMR82435.1 Hint domain-containing protein [Aliiroseovarius halocynthiae]